MIAATKVVAASLLLLASSTACSMFKHPDSMNVSADIPAAKGDVKFAKTDNGNTSINLTLEYLADPQKLQPPATIYVVWVRADQGSAAQNIGALKVDDKRKGTLKTVTPMVGFDLFVTPEQTGQAQEPTGKQLFWTSHRP